MGHYFYTAHWQAGADGAWSLRGVLVADRDRLHAHFPGAAEQQDEWGAVAADVCERAAGVPGVPASPPKNSTLRVSPITVLHQIAERGNGVSEEFDVPQTVEAASLEDAARRAYETARSGAGDALAPAGYGPPVRAISSGHSDPLAGLLPADG